VKVLLRRAAVTALGTIFGVSLLVAAKSGPAGPPVALPAAGVIGRPPAVPAAPGPVATAPPPPPVTASTVPPPPSSSTTGPRAPSSTTTRPAQPPTTATTRLAPPSTATTRALPRPAPTTATTARPTTTSAPPATAPPATAPPATAPTTTTTTAPAAATTTVDSPAFTAAYGHESYGSVVLRVTVQGRRIVDVQAVETPNSHAKSVQINNRAVPILRQEALTAQSAQIDTVSGATATSQAYAQCLQSVLDQVWK